MGDTNAQIGPENGLEHVIGKEGMGMTYENGEILIYLSAQAIIGYRWNNLHHWHYSPGWALASSNKCRQRLLSWATIFQFLHSIFLKSCSTQSIHLSFGLPRPRCAAGFEFNILLVISLSIRATWPAHLSLFILIKLIISQSFNISYSSQLNLLLHIPFSKIGPAILRRILLSNTPNLLSSSSVKIQVSDA